jgi:hypothetical protein
MWVMESSGLTLTRGPARANDVCQTASVVAVGLVQLQRERYPGVPGIQADRG